MIDIADRKILLIIIIAIIVLVLIAAAFFLYFYNFKPKTDLFKFKTGELKEAYSALAKIKSIDPTNFLIKAEVGLPRPDPNQKSQLKEFSLRVASSTQFSNNSSLDQLKPGDFIYIESQENILNPEFNSLTIVSLQRIKTFAKNKNYE